MVSDQHKCIFVHLRRTGENSIELALGGIVLLNEKGRKTLTWNNSLHRGRNIPHKLDYRGHYSHDPATAIRKQYPAKFNNYMKFSIVRNPWDQMVSLYHRLNVKDRKPQNLAQFIKRYRRLEGTVPEHSLFDKEGKCLMDEIGRFENLEQDYVDICRKFGIDTDPLNHTNGSHKSHYSKYYDKESKELVSRVYQRDIAYFGYTFSQT